MYYKKSLGRHFEQQALAFLKNQGMRPLHENFQCKMGEIDLIMKDQEDIVFVEVRSKSGDDYGHPLFSIDKHKIKKLIRTATYYLVQEGCLYTTNSRFDVITFTPDTEGMKLEWIKNAFLVEKGHR